MRKLGVRIAEWNYTIGIEMKNPVTERIKEYLLSGGLFNPELMEHQKVRDLLVEAAAEIKRLEEYEWMYKELNDE
jgi:hypothetical protein